MYYKCIEYWEVEREYSHAMLACIIIIVRIQHAHTLRHQSFSTTGRRTCLPFPRLPGGGRPGNKMKGEKGRVGSRDLRSIRRWKRRRQRSWLTRRWRPLVTRPANTAAAAHLHTAVPRSRDVTSFAYSCRPRLCCCCWCRFSLSSIGATSLANHLR